MSNPLHHPLPEHTAPDALVERIRAGDGAAFDALVVQYGNMMARYATALVASPDDADDVVQTVLVRLWRLRAEWRVTTSVSSYLLGAVRNEALNRRRKQQSAVRIATALDAVNEWTTHRAIDDAIIDRADLAASLRSLPDRRREAVVLRYGLGMTAVQAARVMGTTSKAVELLAVRGLRALRDWFSRR